MRHRPKFTEETKGQIAARLSWLEKPARKGVLSEYIAQAILSACRKNGTRWCLKPVSTYTFLYALEIASYTEDHFLIAYTWVTLGKHLRDRTRHLHVRKNLPLLRGLVRESATDLRESHILHLRIFIREAQKNSRTPKKVRLKNAA